MHQVMIVTVSEDQIADAQTSLFLSRQQTEHQLLQMMSHVDHVLHEPATTYATAFEFGQR